jgi:hypothetical protein
MTRPDKTRITMRVSEALTSEWQPEGVIAEYVRQHESSPVASRDIAFALRRLKRDGAAESIQFTRHRGKWWRLAD